MGVYILLSFWYLHFKNWRQTDTLFGKGFFFNSLCLFLICGVPGPCSNDFFHTALIIKFIHFPSCTIPLNKKLWVITPLMLRVQRREGHVGAVLRGEPHRLCGSRVKAEFREWVLRYLGLLNSQIIPVGYDFMKVEKFFSF